jgi:Tol biopolymer transport system component
MTPPSTAAVITITPAAIISVAPSPTPAQPTAGHTPSPALTPTAAIAAVPRQLTQGGCCVQPFWSPDSRQVRYIDRPSSGEPSGIWAVSATGGAPTFVTARLGLYSPDEALVAYPESGQTFIERVGGERWQVPTGGRALLFSPDSTQIAWQVASSSVNFDTRKVAIWVAAVDGTGAHKLADLAGGGLNGWFPDGQRLLITERADDLSQIETISLADGSRTVIASAARFQGIALSPQGGWVAYTVAFSGDPAQDGLHVVKSDGQASSRLDTFGAFTWRSEGRLLVIPLEPEAASNRLLEYQAENGFARPMTDPALTLFQIASGNWALSPDGRRLAFVSAADHNLWVLDLPE